MENLYNNAVFWWIYLSLAVRLLGADRLALAVFLVIPVIALPFVFIYGVASIYTDSAALKISVIAITTLTFLAWYLWDNFKNRESWLSDSTFREYVADYLNILIEKICLNNTINYSNTYEVIFSDLDKKYREQVDNQSTNFLLAIVFFITSYYLLKDNKGFETFIDHDISAWLKYAGLFFSFVVFLYAYSKYYSIFPKSTYKAIFKIVRLLAKEKKYVLLVKPADRYAGYGFSVERKLPRARHKKTNYYHFAVDKDGEIAYWLEPSIDYRHYNNVTFQFRRIGIEGFLDKVLKK